jgi:hypothetical protein
VQIRQNFQFYAQKTCQAKPAQARLATPILVLKAQLSKNLFYDREMVDKFRAGPEEQRRKA